MSTFDRLWSTSSRSWSGSYNDLSGSKDAYCYWTFSRPTVDTNGKTIDWKNVKKITHFTVKGPWITNTKNGTTKKATVGIWNQSSNGWLYKTSVSSSVPNTGSHTVWANAWYDSTNTTYCDYICTRFKAGNTVQNRIQYTKDSWSCRVRSNNNEMQIWGEIQDAQCKYFDGTNWVPCEVYYFTSSTANTKCEVQYFDGSTWKPLTV